jgi:glycosyltransferase involved in cell wall biosynthesis
LIRKQLPEARIEIYGAYPPEEVMVWNNVKNGIEVKGSALTLDGVFESARVNVAPLRFGAGVKGKIMEGFRYGVPCVTTKVGVEGLFPLDVESGFPGIESNSPESFANACVKLHEDEALWKRHSLSALEKMMQVFASAKQVPELKTMIGALLEKKKNQQLPDWISKVMRFEGNQSRYYFTKWIELKETQKGSDTL